MASLRSLYASTGYGAAVSRGSRLRGGGSGCEQHGIAIHLFTIIAFSVNRKLAAVNNS